MTRPIHIRQATLADAPEIARVQVETWGVAYRGLVPDALIDQMRVPDRTTMWEKILNTYDESGRGAAAVAERDGEIVGFGSWNPQREAELEDEGFTGEVTSLYVLSDHQRAGVGRALMSWLGHGLADGGHAAAALWVLSNNAGACAFYEALGGEAIRTRTDPHGGDVSETAFGWVDLSALTR
ncbi:GNAT family N-acetyltransferase [Celeribacter sp.]|uniref:GNAT family N-acetyltransferase n=1 Tax=Celeribacter sp. TaxID=1890673 RepID=UPI003A9347CB